MKYQCVSSNFPTAPERPPDPKRRAPGARPGAPEGGIVEGASQPLRLGRYFPTPRGSRPFVIVGPDSLDVGLFASLNEARLLLNGRA